MLHDVDRRAHPDPVALSWMRSMLKIRYAKSYMLSKHLKKKHNKISKVLRMGLPIVENLSGLSGNIFSLSRIPQLHFNSKSKNLSNYINIP